MFAVYIQASNADQLRYLCPYTEISQR